jgi:hypothetical protein
MSRAANPKIEWFDRVFNRAKKKKLRAVQRDLEALNGALASPDLQARAKAVAEAAAAGNDEEAERLLGEMKTAKRKEEAAALRRDLDAVAKPADLEPARLAIIGQLDRLDLEAAGIAIEQHKTAVSKLAAEIASLRSELSALGALPTGMAASVLAFTADLDSGALVAAKAKFAPVKESLAELKALATKFAELTKAPAADLAENQKAVLAQLDGGDVAGARAGVPKYEQDLAKLKQGLSALQGELGKLAEVPKLAAERAAITQEVELGALAAGTKALEVYRELLARRLTQIDRQLRALDPAPAELTADRAAVQKNLDESNVVEAFKSFELYQRKRNATLNTSLPADLEKLIQSLPAEIRDLPKMGALLAAVKDRLDCRDYAGAILKLKACEKFAKGIQEPKAQKFLDMETIRKELNKTYDRAVSLPLMLMRGGKNSSAEEYRSLVRKLLQGNATDPNNVAARAELDAFKKEVDRAIRATPRAGVEMQQLLQVEETHRKIGVQNANYARNTEMARSVALRVVREDGTLALESPALWADMPFAPSDEVSAARSDLEGADVAALASSKHVAAMLKRIGTDKKLQAIIGGIKKPDPANPACAMVRATLGLPVDVEVTEVHARQAAISALLSQLRQNDVGSCFATAIAIEAQAKKPDVFLEDMKNLLETGKIVRQRTQLDRKIKLKRTDPDVADTPGLRAALGAMGIDKADMAAARQAALVELRKATPAATQDEFTPEQIFDQITKNRKGSKAAEAVALELQAAKSAFLAAGKVEIPLNLEMSPTDLRASIPVPSGPTDLHTTPAFGAALEGLGIEPKDGQKAIDDALTKLKAAAASGTTEFKFTAEQILKQVVKDRVKTTPPADPPEKAESELAAATKAFQATQDNRLLRAWEYTVTEMAELSEEQGQQIRKGTRDAAMNRVDTAAITATGADVARLAQFRKDVKAKFDERFKEQIKIRYDASVETEKSADGSSSRGVWVMEEAATGAKITDKAGQDAVIKKLMAEVLATFSDPKEQGWGTTLTASLNTGPLTTADPPKKTGAAYGAIESMMAAFNNLEAVPLEKTTPASGKELFEWLIAQNQRMQADIGAEVASDPDGAALPLRGGPHVFSLRPGTPFLRAAAADQGKTPAEHVAEYTAKNKLKDTKLAVAPGEDGPAARIVSTAIKNAMHSSWADIGIGALEDLGSEISVSDLSKVVDEVVADLTAQNESERDDVKAKNREGQSKAVMAPPPPMGPLALATPLAGKVLEFVTKAVGGADKPRFARMKSILEAKAAAKTEITLAEIQAELDKLLDQEQATADTAARTKWKAGGKKGLAEDAVKDGPLASAVKVPLAAESPSEVSKLITKVLEGVASAAALRPLLDKRIEQMRASGGTNLTVKDLRKMLEAVVKVDSGVTDETVNEEILSKVNAGLTEAAVGETAEIAIREPLPADLNKLVTKALAGVASAAALRPLLEKRIEQARTSGGTELTLQDLRKMLEAVVNVDSGLTEAAAKKDVLDKVNAGLAEAVVGDAPEIAPGLPLTDPMQSPLLDLVNAGLKGIQPMPPKLRTRVHGKIRVGLAALGKASVTPQEVKTAINKVIDGYLAKGQRDKRDIAKAEQRKQLKGAELESTSPVPPVPLGSPLAGPAKKFISKALAGLDPRFESVAATKLGALAATQPTASLDQVEKVVNDVVAEYLAAPEFQAKKDKLTANNKKNLADDLLANGTAIVVPSDPNTDPLAALVTQSLADFPTDAANALRPEIDKRLLALQSSGATDIDLTQIAQVLNDVVQAELAGEADDLRDQVLSKLEENLAEGLVGDAPVYEPDFAVDDAEVARVVQQWANGDAAWEEFGLEKVTGLGKDPVTLKEIREALDNAVIEVEERQVKKNAKAEFGKAVFEDNADPVVAMPLAYPPEGKLKDMIDKSLAHLDEKQRADMKKKMEEELNKRKPATTVGLPTVRKMLDDLVDVNMKADHTKMEDSTRKRLTKNMALAALDELGPPVAAAEVEALVGKTLKRLKVAEPEPANTVKTAAVGAVQALGAPGVSLAEIETEVTKALEASSVAADKVMETLREERRPPLELAKVEPLIALTLKKLNVAAAKTGPVRKAAVATVTQLGSPAVGMADIEAAVVAAYKTVKTPEDEVFEKLTGEVTSPVDEAAVEALVEKILKRLHVDEEFDEVKEKAMGAIVALAQPTLPLGDIEKEVRKAMTAAGVSTEAMVAKKLREEPPGVVFADSNWGGGDQATLFTMVVNPLTDQPEMWQVGEDGSGASPMDQSEWVQGQPWGVASDPSQVGGAV